ncbi:MAG: PAS domain S-box protein [Myxococcales bacterium]|nr:PAS domain S-box protein [Myxococcales bacterium]
MDQRLRDSPSGGVQVPSAEVRRYLDLSRELVVHLTPQGRVVLINRPLARVLGTDTAALAGRDWIDTCVAEPDRAGARRALAQTRDAGTHVCENRLVAADRERTVRWRMGTLEEGDGVQVGLLCWGEDITREPLEDDAKTGPVETALAQAERDLDAYRFALDNSAIVAITDAQGRIVHVNDRQCEIAKYTREELLGRDHRILNSGYHSKEFWRNFWDTIKAGRIWRGDVRNRAKDGSIYWVATTVVPFADERGVPYQYMSIRSEITERKVAEAALERTVRELSTAREEEAQRAAALAEAHENLKQANHQIRQEQAKLVQTEKLSSIGLLAAGVAHEINNPLFGVMACVKALQDNHLEGARRDEYFRTAREGLQRIEQTVRGLLEFAAQRPPSAQLLDADEVLDACHRLVAPLAREKQVGLRLLTEPGCQLLADRSQLMQAVMNILLNAIYVSPPEAEVRVDTVRRASRVGIRVSDHGPGMDEETLNKACDPFYSTKPEGEGTGLGLSVTLSIAKAHGGDLEFDTAPGRGTAVTIWLPAEGA